MEFLSAGQAALQLIRQSEEQWRASKGQSVNEPFTFMILSQTLPSA